MAEPLVDLSCTSDAERIAAAWEQCYVNPLRGLELGREVAQGGGEWAGEGWFHVALGAVRTGDTATAMDALQHARAHFTPLADARGLALCDEIEAICLRCLDDHAGSRHLQEQIDRRGDVGYGHVDRFVACNSRAITLKLLGDVDGALRYFYAAAEAAQASGLEGMRVTALTNLGGYHQDLYNLEEGRSISEQALRLAREVKSPLNIATAAMNLILTYNASGLMAEARAMADFLVNQEAELLPGALHRCALPLAMAHFGVGEFAQAQAYLNHGATAAVGNGDGISAWAWLQARCWMAQGQAQRARELVESTLAQRQAKQQTDLPADTMQLRYAAADACEQLGDTAAALKHVRQAHKMYELAAGRGARARQIGMQASHELARAQLERDVARDSQREAEEARRMLLQLNAALQAQIDETALLHAKLQEQALRDPLTGLHNRRYLFEVAPGMLDLARRKQTPLVVVLIDLDHFKLLNDTYGHHAGDAVLQRFGTLLTQMLRRSDVVCRHGGEEFVAVMPELSPDGAQTMLTRLLQAYQSQQQEVGRRKLPSCSFSAGIAQFPAHGHTLERLLSRADRALYTAKARGRSRIEQMPMTDFGTMV